MNQPSSVQTPSGDGGVAVSEPVTTQNWGVHAISRLERIGDKLEQVDRKFAQQNSLAGSARQVGLTAAGVFAGSMLAYGAKALVTRWFGPRATPTPVVGQ